MQLSKEYVYLKFKEMVHILYGETIIGSDDSISEKSSAKTSSYANGQLLSKQRRS